MKNKKIKKALIVVPAQDQLGGVYNFYKNLEIYLDKDVKFFNAGEPKYVVKNKVVVLFMYLIGFLKQIITQKPKTIILNTSLNLNAVLRDSIYVLLAKLLGKKVVVFWRGWNFNHEKYLRFPYLILTWPLLKVDKAIVLYSKIDKSLKELGYKNRTYGLTTMVGDIAFDYQISNDKSNYFNLIFLSRVENYKGINELLSAFVLLKKKYSNIKLIIAGNGKQLQDLLNEVSSKGIKDVEFAGYVKGKEKYELLSKANLFVFPSYSEGMPNAVLEAMAVGLPIITTPVGGINDFFVEEKMGKFLKIRDIDSVVNAVEDLYLNSNLRIEMSKENINFAHANFRGEVVYNKLKQIIDN